ncbi:MAG: POTRA domain-containing protein [Spirochaetota bacterium]
MRHSFLFPFCIHFFAISLLSILSSQAVREIHIRGVSPARKQKIQQVLGIKMGDTLNKTQLNHSLKRLYTQGVFAQIEFLQEPLSQGIRFIVAIHEKPTLTQLLFASEKLNSSQKAALQKKFVGHLWNQNLQKKLTQHIRELLEENSYIAAKTEFVSKQLTPQNWQITVKIKAQGKYRVAKISYQGFTPGEEAFFRKRSVLQTGSFFSRYFNIRDYREDITRMQEYFQKQGYLQAKVNASEPGWRYVGKKYFWSDSVEVSYALRKGRRFRYIPFSLRTSPSHTTLYASRGSRKYETFHSTSIPNVRQKLLEFKTFSQSLSLGQAVPGLYQSSLRDNLTTRLRREGRLLVAVQVQEQNYTPTADFWQQFHNCPNLSYRRKKRCYETHQDWKLTALQQFLTSNPQARQDPFQQMQFRVQRYFLTLIEEIVLLGFTSEQEQTLAFLQKKYKGKPANPEFWDTLQKTLQKLRDTQEIKTYFRRGTHRKKAYVILKAMPKK